MQGNKKKAKKAGPTRSSTIENNPDTLLQVRSGVRIGRVELV